MAKVLRHAAVAAAAAALAGIALADDSGSDRNRFQFEIDASYVHADSPLGAWTDGGLGKLRYAETNDGLESTRVFGQYRGRIANTLSATVIADYQSDASSGIDVTEAYMDWRPVPKSENQQQIRFGAFYPPLSLERRPLPKCLRCMDARPAQTASESPDRGGVGEGAARCGEPARRGEPIVLWPDPRYGPVPRVEQPARIVATTGRQGGAAE